MQQNTISPEKNKMNKTQYLVHDYKTVQVMCIKYSVQNIHTSCFQYTKFIQLYKKNTAKHNVIYTIYIESPLKQNAANSSSSVFCVHTLDSFSEVKLKTAPNLQITMHADTLHRLLPESECSLKHNATTFTACSLKHNATTFTAHCSSWSVWSARTLCTH